MEWLLDSKPDLIAGIGFVFYFMFVIYGYLFMTDARFWEAIDKHKMVALIAGPILYVVLGVVQEFAVIPHWFVVVYHRSLFPWLVIIAALGYGKKYLNAAPKHRLSAGFLMYFGEGSYAYYLLHQTVLVVIAFYVVQWVPSTKLSARAGITTKYVIIAVTTFVATIAVYELLVRRIGISRFLFGMGPKRKPQEVSDERPREAVA
jgi:peptidoglycan/LPS O-acetylase OafA/YrhL